MNHYIFTVRLAGPDGRETIAEIKNNEETLIVDDVTIADAILQHIDSIRNFELAMLQKNISVVQFSVVEQGAEAQRLQHYIEDKCPNCGEEALMQLPLPIEVSDYIFTCVCESCCSFHDMRQDG